MPSRICTTAIVVRTFSSGTTARTSMVPFTVSFVTSTASTSPRWNASWAVTASGYCRTITPPSSPSTAPTSSLPFPARPTPSW